MVGYWGLRRRVIFFIFMLFWFIRVSFVLFCYDVVISLLDTFYWYRSITINKGCSVF